MIKTSFLALAALLLIPLTTIHAAGNLEENFVNPPDSVATGAVRMMSAGRRSSRMDSLSSTNSRCSEPIVSGSRGGHREQLHLPG